MRDVINRKTFVKRLWRWLARAITFRRAGRVSIWPLYNTAE